MKLKSDFPVPTIGNKYTVLAGSYAGQKGECVKVKQNDFGHVWASLKLKGEEGMLTIRSKLLSPVKKTERKEWPDNAHQKDERMSQYIQGGP